MLELINNTVSNYKALIYKLAGRQELIYFPWPKLFKATNIFVRIAYDVISQGRCRKLIKVSPYKDGLCKVIMGEYSFYYPGKADLAILGRTYYEIFNHHCGHFYDINQTCPKDNDIVLDIGTCEGLYGLKHLNNIRKIYMFEPSSMMCRCLRLTYADYDSSRYEIMNMILSSRPDEEVYFAENEDDPTMSGIVADNTPGGRRFETKTVDSLVNSQRIEVPTVLKMDVQGSELMILQGAESTIREHKPRMAITTYHNPMDATQIIDYCLKLRPDYHYILKGITTSNPIPRPTMVHFF